MRRGLTYLALLGALSGCRCDAAPQDHESHSAARRARPTVYAGASDWQPPPLVSVRVTITAESITRLNPFEAIEPVWSGANIYGSAAEYEASLRRFSRPQRFIFAIQWYEAEVNNGGHEQFFSNSTGIVWRDALDAFQEIDAPAAAAILREAVSRFPGVPSRERDARLEQLERIRPNFEDLDDRFYALNERQLYDAEIRYMRTHAFEFVFDGYVERLAPRDAAQ